MSMLDAVKDKVVGQAMRFMSDPRISRVMGDQRVMSAAMRAVGVGGSIKAELDRATRFAAGLLGFATQEEVSALRSTVQTLEDNLAVMESKAQSMAACSLAGSTFFAGAPAGKPSASPAATSATI